MEAFTTHTGRVVPLRRGKIGDAPDSFGFVPVP